MFILVAHGDYKKYFDASTQEALDHSALSLLKYNREVNDFYYDEDADTVDDILERKDAKAALKFLESRKDHEYEGITIERVWTKDKPIINYRPSR